MKKSIISVLLILILGLSILISCTTTPKLEEGQPGTLGYVTAARQKAVDFESPEYFPSEWEELETKYNAAVAASGTKTPLKPEEYNALADSYNEIFNKTIPLYAQAREDELMESREHIVNSGFSKYFPDYLKSADDKALAAKEQYEAGDYYKARDTAAEAQKEYDELKVGTKVYLARQEVIDRGFVKYDANNFDKADDITKAALKDYDAGEKDAAIEKAEEAILRYNIVLSNGWTSYAADRKSISSKERELAIAEKANIASRETFRKADGIFDQADALLKAEKFDEAAVSFTEAEAMFAIARIETEEKRVNAESAINKANQMIGASGETATEAERIIEGGAR